MRKNKRFSAYIKRQMKAIDLIKRKHIAEKEKIIEIRDELENDLNLIRSRKRQFKSDEWLKILTDIRIQSDFQTHFIYFDYKGDVVSNSRFLDLAKVQPYRLLQRPPRPDWATQRQFLALGLPSSIAIWVEVTSFTALSLLMAPMGETASAAQQIASTTAALLYMWPLSLAIAGSARVSYWQGQQQAASAHRAQRSTLLLTLASASLFALLLALLRQPMASLYVQDAAVQQLAASLLLIVAAYHLAGAFQVCGLFLLRCYHVVRLPTLIYSVMLWGLGLGGGYWLAWHGPPAWRGPHALWIMVALAMTLVAGLFLWLLQRVSRPVAGQPDH